MIGSFYVLYELYAIFENLWKFFNIVQNLVKSVDFCKRLKLLPNNWKIYTTAILLKFRNTDPMYWE